MARRKSEINDVVDIPELGFGTQLTLRLGETRRFRAGKRNLFPGTVTFKNEMCLRSSFVDRHAFNTAQDGVDCEDLRDVKSGKTPVCSRGVMGGPSSRWPRLPSTCLGVV